MSQHDSRTVSQLFAASTDWTIEGGEGDMSAVCRLHAIGTREVLDLSINLADSDDPRRRARAADILGQLGVPVRSFPDECLFEVLALAADPDARVVASACIALGHLKDTRGVPALVQMIDHPDQTVRFSIAFALGGRGEDAAIDALIHLTNDPEPEVRDWATFGLGAVGTTDTPAIRSALSSRLNDSDEQTRYEAICGLAKLCDSRAITPLINAIENDPGDSSFWAPAFEILKIGSDKIELTAVQLVSYLNQIKPKSL